MNNKWMKWMIGIGGISTFTLLLQSIDANNQTNLGEEAYTLKEEVNVLNVDNTQSITPQKREQQLMALDWNEGNWDVETTNNMIIATPKNQEYIDRSEQRTRRS